jgi:predicted O-linked N-acetylglucosamine transferase (SPINDLY family)
MYRKLQITDCIATDPQHYIDIAVRVATDHAYAQSLRERILSRNHVLFEDGRVVEEFERFFMDALREKRGALKAESPVSMTYSVSFPTHGR